MFRSCVVLLLALAGCSPPSRTDAPSPCAIDEGSYACQIERYHNVNAS